MAKKVQASILGFNKSKFKGVKDFKSSDILIGDFIQYGYGPEGVAKNKLKKYIGKVIKLYHNGVELSTDYGYQSPHFDRIQLRFVYKTTGKLKPTKILCRSAHSLITYNDSAITRLVRLLKNENLNVNIKDDKFNKTTNYFRHLTITLNNNYVITVAIPNKTFDSIAITGLPKKMELKLNKSHTIAPSKFKAIIDFIKQENEINNGVNAL